jgi:hypothetical protein
MNNKTAHIRFLSGLALTLLAGCAAVVSPHYAEPTGADTASLTFAKTDDFLVLPSIFANASDCSGRNLVPAIPDNGQETRKVPSGRPLSISLLRARDYFSLTCTRIVTFTPVAGHRYTALITGHRSECHIELTDAGTPDNAFEPARTAPHEDRQAVRPFLENGAYCPN